MWAHMSKPWGPQLMLMKLGCFFPRSGGEGVMDLPLGPSLVHARPTWAMGLPTWAMSLAWICMT